MKRTEIEEKKKERADDIAGNEKQIREVEKNMRRIVAFLIGTTGLSLLLLIPVLYLFETIVKTIKKAGLFAMCLPSIWQGFTLIAIVLIMAVATLMALLILNWGETYVVR